MIEEIEEVYRKQIDEFNLLMRIQVNEVIAY